MSFYIVFVCVLKYVDSLLVDTSTEYQATQP